MAEHQVASVTDIATADFALRAGQLVAFPTETVYGLGADARDPRALQQVFMLKGRPSDHPLILHLLSAAELPQWVAVVPKIAEILAAKFWPGPLTLVLHKAAHVSLVLTGGQNTIAVRVPSHPVARALLARFGSGIAAPSANRYGRVSPTCAAHVYEEFPSGLAVILEGGNCELGLESTIVDLTGELPRLLRPGAISHSELEVLVGRVERPGGVHGLSTSARLGGPYSFPRVPGSTAKHYAPQTPVFLLGAAQWPAQLATYSDDLSAVLSFETLPTVLAEKQCFSWLEAPRNAVLYAQALYANLRTLDKCGAARILVEQVPDTSEWDAVRDRLARAAGTFL
ncbi:MAG: threonylcarbamoyl-AMP synthase [Gammaproteobacteria bacterium]|nr:threonylcarbamoyl-AMP synthase [Gammaproteobacteria bacterium]